jgi:hypothetical protein
MGGKADKKGFFRRKFYEKNVQIGCIYVTFQTGMVVILAQESGSWDDGDGHFSAHISDVYIRRYGFWELHDC